MKPAPSGLVLFNGPRTLLDTHKSGIGGIVIDAMNLHWSQINPSAGKFDFTRIDTGLALAAKYGIDADVRIFAGHRAPAWVIQKVGSFTYTDAWDDKTITCPRFWEPGYAEAWSALQVALAAKYDTDPRFGSITHAMPMTLYTEPFMRGVGDPGTRKNFMDAGYTFAKDQACQLRAVAIHKECWDNTWLRLNLNPWQNPETGGGTVPPLKPVIDAAGKYAILQNNSIRWADGGPLGGQYTALYGMMAEYADKGVPVGYQTSTTARIGDATQTLRWALEQGAQWLEVAPDWWTTAPITDAEHYNRLLNEHGDMRAGMGTTSLDNSDALDAAKATIARQDENITIMTAAIDQQGRTIASMKQSMQTIDDEASPWLTG